MFNYGILILILQILNAMFLDKKLAAICPGHIPGNPDLYESIVFLTSILLYWEPASSGYLGAGPRGNVKRLWLKDYQYEKWYFDSLKSFKNGKKNSYSKNQEK